MVKYHLKRLNTPSTWDIDRKSNKFIARPMPCGHKLAESLPLKVVMRDMLKVGKTGKEIKHILHNNNVSVNGKRVKDEKTGVGFMDVIEIKEIKKNYRLVLDKSKRLKLVDIDDKEKNILLMKLKKKSLMKKGRMQLNFSNSFNVLTDQKGFKDIKVGEVAVYDITSKKIIDVLKVEKGNTVFLTGGKHMGEVVKLESVKDNNIIFKTKNNEVYETSLRYCFLLGKASPAVKIE